MDSFVDTTDPAGQKVARLQRGGAKPISAGGHTRGVLEKNRLGCSVGATVAARQWPTRVLAVV
jgi:hypothetical protein